MSGYKNMEREQINDLLAKHFAKETNTAEELIVLEWIKSNPEEYFSLKILWADSHVVQNQQLFSTDKAWVKVAGQISPNEKSTVSLAKRRYTSYWIAAASIVVIISVGLFFYATSSVTVSTKSAEVKNITLSDGSRVTLNENSRMSYPRYFFSKRNVELVEGEAFFEVKHSIKKPFVVHAKQFLVNVLGTSFVVNCTENTMFVNVKSGKVAVKNKQSNDHLILLGGQGARYVSRTLQKETLHNENYLAWKTKELTFTDSPLREVFPTLENYYHVKITVDTTDSLNCNVSTKFKNESLEGALKELQLYFKFNYKITGNEVSISGIICR